MHESCLRPMPSSGAVAWPPPSVRQRQLEHRALEGLVRTLPNGVPEGTDEALCRYLVVRSCGLVEAVRDDAADFYSKTVGHVRIHRRISQGLRNGLGVTPKQLLDFVGSFDVAWSDELQSFLLENDGARSNDLGALAAARKKIAHGDGEQVTTRKALQWSATADDVANWILRRFDPR